MVYNVDKILAANASAAKVLFAIWEVLSPAPSAELLPEEEVILDGWNFDLGFGNGMVNMIRGEDFEGIVLGFRSLESLRASIFQNFVADMLSVFEEFSLWGSPKEKLARKNQLAPTEWNNLRRRLGQAEEPYQKPFWHDELIMEKLFCYLEQNLPVFRRRRDA